MKDPRLIQLHRLITRFNDMQRAVQAEVSRFQIVADRFQARIQKKRDGIAAVKVKIEQLQERMGVSHEDERVS